MFRYGKTDWYIAVLLISLVAIVLFTEKPEATLTEKIAGLVGDMVYWCVVLLFFAGLSKLETRFTGGHFRGSIGPHTFEIGEDTFSESNALGRQEVRIAGLRRVAETNLHFFVIANTGFGYVIPKRDLQSFDVLYALQKRVAERANP